MLVESNGNVQYFVTERACHVATLVEYLSFTHAMLSRMLEYNNHCYGKWLPVYWDMASLLPYGKKKHFNEHFAQLMTGLPYYNQPMICGLKSP